jgi:hypothetical protein
MRSLRDQPLKKDHGPGGVVTLIMVTRRVRCTDGERRVAVDTVDLPPALALPIEALLSQLDLVDLESRSPMRGRGGRYEYDVKVHRGVERHVFTCEEGNVGRVLGDLLELLLVGPLA